MWVGDLTDVYYEDAFSLVCLNHKNQKNEIKNKDKIAKMLRDTFTLMKVKALSFILEDEFSYHSDVYREWLHNMKLFSKKFFQSHEEKVDYKDTIILIDSVTTFTLALLSKICCICTKVGSLDDLKAHRDKQELCQTATCEAKFFESVLCAALHHSHYPKVKAQFVKYNTAMVNYAFTASCYTFATTFGTDIKEFWDNIVETQTYHQFKLRGNEAYNNKEFDVALHVYLDALKQYPYAFHLFSNCAQVCLMLQNYKSAELLSRCALIINPQWCKAYYKLAMSLSHQKKTHNAHIIAAFGLRQCQATARVERDSLRDYITILEKDCAECRPNHLPLSFADFKKMHDDMQQQKGDNPDSGDSSIPDLTDSTDPSSDETDSMSEVETSESHTVDSVDNGNKEQVPNTTLEQVADNEDGVLSLPLDQVADNEDGVLSLPLDQVEDNKDGVSSLPLDEVVNNEDEVSSLPLDQVVNNEDEVPSLPLDQAKVTETETCNTSLDKTEKNEAIFTLEVSSREADIKEDVLDSPTNEQIQSVRVFKCYVRDYGITLEQLNDVTEAETLVDSPLSEAKVEEKELEKRSDCSVSSDNNQQAVLNAIKDCISKLSQEVKAKWKELKDSLDDGHPNNDFHKKVEEMVEKAKVITSQVWNLMVDFKSAKDEILNIPADERDEFCNDFLKSESIISEQEKILDDLLNELEEMVTKSGRKETSTMENIKQLKMKLKSENNKPFPSDCENGEVFEEGSESAQELRIEDYKDMNSAVTDKDPVSDDQEDSPAIKKPSQSIGAKAPEITKEKPLKFEDLSKLLPTAWPRLIHIVNRFKSLRSEAQIQKLKKDDAETYKRYIECLETLSTRFDLINDLQAIAIEKQTLTTIEEMDDENEEKLQQLQVREKSVIEELEGLENLIAQAESFPLDIQCEKTRQCPPVIPSKVIKNPQSLSSSAKAIISGKVNAHSKREKSPKIRENGLHQSQAIEKEMPIGRTLPSLEEINSSDQTCLDYKTVVNFENALTEGASAVKMGLMSIAMLHFSQAVDMVKQVPELCDKFKLNAVAVKFVYGFACYKSYSLESMNWAINVFKEIIGSEEKHLAPIHYLLGLSFSKLHKFRVALAYLKTVALMVEEDFNFDICNLLDENSIKEIKYDCIQASLRDEISKCECPPPPDALCRYKSCILNPAIYFADLSFKKFMCVRCQERCVLQYHVTCWKSIKESFSKTDKEFLDCPCFTPDCDGLIIKVEMVGKDGVLERDFTSEGNYKPKKCVKQKKTKLEKKQEQKQRKRRQVRSRTASENLEACADEPEPVVGNAQTNEVNNVENMENLRKAKRVSIDDIPAIADEEAKPGFDVSVNTEPMYIIKKDASEKGQDNKPSKHKERKKPKKSVLTIDEFCESYSASNVTTWNEYQCRLHRLQESKRVVEELAAGALTPKWSSNCDNATPYTYETADHFENPNAVEDALDNFEPVDEYYEAELRTTINQHFENFLQSHGFIKLTDPLLLEEICKLSKEARDLIDRKGGFLPFLQGSKEFAIVNDNLCQFNDMMNLYESSFNVSRRYSSNEVLENISLGGSDPVNELDVSPDIETNSMCHYISQICNPKKIEELDDFTEGYATTNEILDNISMCEASSKPNEIVTSLNPNAEEYNPSKENSSEDSHSSQEALKNGLSPSCESLSLIDNSFLSRVAGMRQELKSYTVVDDLDKKFLDLEEKECPEPEPPKVEVKQVSVVQQKTDLSSNMSDYPVFVDVFHAHFEKLIKAGEVLKINKAYQCLKFLMQQLAKTHGYTVDASEQVATTDKVTMVSQGVMKEDNELIQLTVEAEILKNLNRKIAAEKTSVEQQLTEALDKQTEIQNKYLVETVNLKKEVEDNQVAFQEEIQTQKKKNSSLEKELKLWRQKHTQQMDKEKESHTEYEILQMKTKNLGNKVSELEKERDNLNMEYQLKISSHNDVLLEYDRHLQKEMEEKTKAQTEAFQLKEGLKTAQLEILHIKRTEYYKAFGVTLDSVNNNIQELQNGMHQTENMNPIVRSTLQTLETKLNEYIRDMHSTRLEFIAEIADQQKQVENGVSLTHLPKLVIPTFPPIPTIETILKKDSSEQTLQNVMISPEQKQQVPVNSFRVMEQQPPTNSFQDFSSQMYHQNMLGSVPYSMNPAIGAGLAKSSVPRQAMGALSMQPQQNNLFPNFNVPLFGSYQPQRPSILNTVISLPPQPLPIGTQLSKSTNDPFSSSVSFNQKLPPGLHSQPSSSTGSISSPTVDFDQKTPPLPPDSRQPRSTASSLISLSDAESLTRAVKMGLEPIIPEVKRDLTNTDTNGSLSVPPTKTAAASKEFVTENFVKKSTAYVTGTAGLELDYSSTLKPVNAAASVQKQTVLGTLEANGTVPTDKSAAGLKVGYRKIIDNLKIEFPTAKDADIMLYVKEYRAEKGGRLSNLPFTTIIADIREIMLRNSKPTSSNVVVYPPSRPKSLVNKPLTSCSAAAPPPPIPKTTPTIAPWAKAAVQNEKIPQNWFNDPSEKSCAICLEEMTRQTAHKMDCGHHFHFKCIKQWLNKQSNCPVCRVHLLLPEDFPSLS